MTWDTVTIVGVGLIGGSIGLALSERRLAQNIIGVGRRTETLRQARLMGAVTETQTEFESAFARSNLIIVCTPVDMVVDVVRLALQHAPPHALITDVGSVKGSIVASVNSAAAELRNVIPPPREKFPEFLGSHPMAGSEKGGVEFAKADLFFNRPSIVTPTEQNSAEKIRDIQSFWEKIGARVLTMSPAAHDVAVADVSHLPHLIASVLAAATPDESLPLASSGWADTTRIAAGDVELWRQILLANRVPTLQALARFEKVLSEFRMALEHDSQQPLAELLAAGKRRRDSLAS